MWNVSTMEQRCVCTKRWYLIQSNLHMRPPLVKRQPPNPNAKLFPHLPYIVSFWLNGWNTDLGLDMEKHLIASFCVGGDESLASKSSLWVSNLFSEPKIEVNFWPGQICFEGRPLCVPFKTARLHKSTVSAFTCDYLCGESERFLRESNLMIFRPY